VVVQAEFGAVDAGFNPMGSLVEGKAGRFYGTTGGTVYRLDARPGGQLKAIHRFDPEGDGWGSEAALTLSPQGLLYGTNGRGGAHGHGTLFRLATNGQGFETLKSLDGGLEGSDPGVALLRASDGHFYGCTRTGGLHDKGVLFRLGNDSSYTVLHHFRGGQYDGAYPRAALVQGPDGALYGTTVEGGQAPQSYGTVFRLSPRGTLRLIHRFSEEGAEGGTPVGALTWGPDGRLYGTGQSGGAHHCGTVYRLTPPA